MPGFAAFYAAFPRHVDRRAAHKAYASVFRRHKFITADDLAWSAAEYARAVEREGTEPRFVKHPSTWLNAGSFLEYVEDVPDGQEEVGH